MTEPTTIVKTNPLLPAEDYVAMRRQGIGHIEKLGSDIWTEYNNSDPGITILEAVIYAITDLAYRTNFEVKDLLAPEKLTNTTWNQIFYTARQILHNSPVTLLDYRKLIIDIKGVRNAWIEPSKDYEVPVWIDYNFFDHEGKGDCGCNGKNQLCLGELQLNPVKQEEFDQFKEKKKEEITSDWEKAWENFDEVENKIKETDETDTIRWEDLQGQLNRISIRLIDLFKVLIRIEYLTFDPVSSKIVEFEGLYNVMVEYEEDIIDQKNRDDIRALVLERLLRNRNLCEDFISINAVEYDHFGIGASIVLEEYADPDRILAEIFFAIYKYFTPSVRFYTIGQMIEKGYQVDEIFTGPPLKHGFIDSAELEKTDLFRDIRLSDIISEIADIKGIKAITYLHLPFRGPHDPESGKNYFNKWINELKKARKIARIDPKLSQVIFCKEREVITYYTGKPGDKRPQRMLKLFNDLKSLESKYKLSGHDRDFAVPSGEFMELEDYFPVTYSLPRCYGVNDRAGLPLDATEKRKIQALQLSGYLLFFEQILSGYLVQLNHLRDLFSMDDKVERTYFSRPLTEIENLKDLIIDHGNRGENHYDEILEDFSNVLQHIIESPKEFLERRNIFLDHLLARFAEDMSEYEAVSRWLTPYKFHERMIGDKTRMLKNGEYYKISTDRSKGFDYSNHNFWDTENVSGTERRVGRLMGFKDIRRRTLAPDNITVVPVMETNPKTRETSQKLNKKGKPLNVIKILDPENHETVLLTSVEVVEGCCTDELLTEILRAADNRRNFVFHEEQHARSRRTSGAKGDFHFDLADSKDSGLLLAMGEQFRSMEERESAFKKLRNAINSINDNEGLHLVEHILLRPKFDIVLDEAGEAIPVSFLKVCLDDCDTGKGLNEEVDSVSYRKKIYRIPADKCFDEMPWVLEYLRSSDPTKNFDQSFLFREVFTDARSPVPLKFRRYELLVQHVRDLQEFGTERINYEIIWNQEDDPAKSRYSFIIHGRGGVVLAQSLFIFRKVKPADTDKSNDIEKEIEKMTAYFGFELDLYCAKNPCDHNEDPYSFRATVVLPCWPKRLRDATFQNLFEKTLESQSPAHVHLRIFWVGISEMVRFENAYYEWLDEMEQHQFPVYEKVNPLVEVLNSLKSCGCCHDECH